MLGGKAIAIRPTGSPRCCAHVFAHLRHLLQQVVAMVEQALAGLGQGDAAAVAQQQRLAQVGLERPHLPAERRLRHVERARGLAEAAEFRDADEVFELAQIHRIRRLGRLRRHGFIQPRTSNTPSF